MDYHPVQGRVAIFLGMLQAKETGIGFGRVSLWFMCAFGSCAPYLYLSHFTRKSIHDQDNADLRAVKEMFLPDGDLYTDGQGRTRHFRWRGIDENSQFGLFGNKDFWNDEDGTAIELSTDEEIQRRKERYEREAFLREEKV